MPSEKFQASWACILEILPGPAEKVLTLDLLPVKKALPTFYQLCLLDKTSVKKPVVLVVDRN